MSEIHVAVHVKPVWRDRANFLIEARIPDSEGHHIQREQLWVRQLESQSFELCCIPFHLNDVALGDVVRTNERFEMEGVVWRTGHATYRVWFGDQPASPTDVEAAVKAIGGATEWSGSQLMAIDAPDSAVSQAIADYLCALQRDGQLEYETGDTVPP